MRFAGWRSNTEQRVASWARHHQDQNPEAPHYTKGWKIVGTSPVNLPRSFRETAGANCTVALLNQAIFGKGN